MKHIDTRIFRRALELVDLVRQALDELPSGYAFLADQLRRAAASVPLNFAEGCAKRTVRERRRYFDTARGSAYEVAAALAVAERFGVIDAHLRQSGEDIADHLGAMLARYR
jgi:four helix bundle protein